VDDEKDDSLVRELHRLTVEAEQLGRRIESAAEQEGEHRTLRVDRRRSARVDRRRNKQP
jgi:hypothetical protein